MSAEKPPRDKGGLFKEWPFCGLDPRREVPGLPEPAKEIVRRALALVKYRPLEQLFSLAAAAEWMVMTSRMGDDGLPLGPPAALHTQLKNCIGRFDLSSDSELIDATPHEFFAVVALHYAMHGARALERPTENARRDGYEAFIAAMDALCHAEHLHQTMLAVKAHDLVAKALMATQDYQVELVRANAENVARMVAEQISEKISMHTRVMADNSHARHREWKKNAIHIFNEHQSEFSGMSNEGVAELIFKYHPFDTMKKKPTDRTMETYIADHRRKIGKQLPRGKPPRAAPARKK